jgi:hypothetical protein
MGFVVRCVIFTVLGCVVPHIYTSYVCDVSRACTDVVLYVSVAYCAVFTVLGRVALRIYTSCVCDVSVGRVLMLSCTCLWRAVLFLLF